MTTKAFAALRAGDTLHPFEYILDVVGPHDVEVKISHCGICHSDVHLIDNDWGISTFPLVPGHEIVGTVISKGIQVKHLEVGQRVGIGWQRSACLDCYNCIRGDDNLCTHSTATCVGNFGGFSEYILTDSRFAFPLPEKLASENAAPLMCGGITVYSPLAYYGITPAMKVGVIGIGGLGHLALQFASKMGCEVTAFTTSEAKREEAVGFGAHYVVSSTDKEDLGFLAGSFDFIISTVFADLDWSLYLSLLRPNGRLCFVGVPKSNISVPAFPLISGRRSIVGSCIGSRAMMGDMLEFSARHNIQAKTEVMPMAEANAAIQRVRNNSARYRMVLAV